MRAIKFIQEKYAILRSALIATCLALLSLSVGACGYLIEVPQPTALPQAAPPVDGGDSAPPLDASAQEILLARRTPSAVLVLDDTGQAAAVYGIDGSKLSEWPLQGVISGAPLTMHLAGSWKGASDTPPLVFFAFQPERAMTQVSNGAQSSLREISTFIGLAGAGGQPAFAFSDLFLEGGAPFSRLYAGTPASIGAASPLLEFSDARMGMALLPVAVDAEGGEPRGVWVAQTAWGIGGADLVFPVNRGLVYVDVSTAETRQILDESRNFQGLSPDRRWAASVDFALDRDKGLRVHNLESGAAFTFSLAPQSGRGAGFAVFSPDGQTIAWLEAGGSLVGDPLFTPRVRVGDLAGRKVTAEVEAAAVEKLLEWEQVSWMRPAGFLDDRTLIIEARSTDGKSAAILRYTLSSHRLTLFCMGSFSGFGYP